MVQGVVDEKCISEIFDMPFPPIVKTTLPKLLVGLEISATRDESLALSSTVESSNIEQRGIIS